MNEFIVRPTLKFIKAGAMAAAIVFLGLEIAYVALWRDKLPAWVIALPPLILLWPLARWLKWRAVRMVVAGDRLRYEKGLVSKDIRNLELSKIQCVNVRQSLMQRLFHVGTISFETAGQGTWTPMPHVDNPQQLADELMNRAHGAPPQLL